MTRLTAFVPPAELAQLTRGSYESLQLQVESAIDQARERLFGSPAPVQVLGTFAGHAVVLSEQARVYRVRFEATDTGEISPVHTEELSVPAYRAENVASFVKKTAEEYVDSFFAGARTDAAEKLQAVVTRLAELPPTHTASTIKESFERLVTGDRPWKTLFADRQKEIGAVVSEDVAQLAQDRAPVREKFARLYSGAVPKEDLVGYSDLVTSDLKHLSSRVSRLRTTLDEAVSKLQGGVPALKPATSDISLQMFEAFSQDLAQDVRGVEKSLSEAVGTLITIDDHAKIYDVLASQLNRYEVAGLFVEKMSKQLSESRTEDH